MEVHGLHMFQLSRFEREAPVLNGQLPSSRLFLKSSVLLLSWLKRQVFMNFSNLDMKILAASNEISCVRCSRLPSYPEQ